MDSPRAFSVSEAPSAPLCLDFGDVALPDADDYSAGAAHRGVSPGVGEPSEEA